VVRTRGSSGRSVVVELTKAPGVALHAQVFNAIRGRIVDGSLRPAAPIASTRALACDLRVSRSTILLAIRQLKAEGYIECRRGAATRVCRTLPDRFHRAASESTHATSPAHHGVPSSRARRVSAIPRSLDIAGSPPRAFRVAVPAVDTFPVDAWGRILARRWRRTPARGLAYGSPLGYLPLREAIAEYMTSARGTRTTAERIMIVNGSQEALDLTCRVVLDPGDAAWLEDPGYFGARGALTAAGARIVPVPVDADGLCVAHGVRVAPHARLAYVTPARQMPLGVTLSLGRRLELVAWARKAKSWILEDDYDSEFRYAGRPLAALHGLDSNGSVIFAGSFSKVLFPGLRLGYIVIPSSLMDAFSAMRHFLNYSSHYLEQAVLADFIAEGHFERHIRRTRAVYFERQHVLVDTVRCELAGRMTVAPADAGLSLVGWLPDRMSDAMAAEMARKRTVDVWPLSSFSMRRLSPGLILGYAGLSDVEIRGGVERLSAALEDAYRVGRAAI
jgi:GntR family transcriptional regulator / MocR family aminotransferase